MLLRVQMEAPRDIDLGREGCDEDDRQMGCKEKEDVIYISVGEKIAGKHKELWERQTNWEKGCKYKEDVIQYNRRIADMNSLMGSAQPKKS